MCVKSMCDYHGEYCNTIFDRISVPMALLSQNSIPTFERSVDHAVRSRSMPFHPKKQIYFND